MSLTTEKPRRLRGTRGWRGLPVVEHFPVWMKLVVLGAVLLVPLAFSLGSQVRTNYKDKVGFALKEKAGQEMMSKVIKLIEDVEASRFQSASYSGGDKDALDNLKTMNAAVQADVQALDEQASQMKLIGVSDDWQQVKQTLSEVSTNDLSYSSEQTAQKFTIAGDAVSAFNRVIGDKSGLTLDPDLDTHYATDIFIIRVAEIEQGMGKSSALLASLAAQKKKLGNADREALDRLAAILQWQSDQMNKSYDRMFEERSKIYGSSDPLQMKTALDPFLADARKAIAQYARYAENVSLGTAKVDDWETTAAEGITNLDSFSNTFLPKVGLILDNRVTEHKKDIVFNALLAVVGIAAFGLLAFYIASDITRPLRATLAVANSIAKGDINFSIPEVNRRDEFGTLNKALREMVANLQEILNSIGTTVQTLTAATSEIMTTTSELAVSSTQMATAVNEATTTVEEVKQTAQVSSQRAQQVAQSAQQAAQVSQAGRQATDETLEEMNRIKEQMLSIAESIVRLSEQTQAISEIIASVNDLAEQSNLLAVNASIEAAKAGEQGRGFAVVAQEVRHLAEQSKQSTAQVRNILSDIQKATGGAVMVAEQGTKAVELGVRQSKEAGDSIKTLATRVVEAAQAAVQISASTHQQLVGMDQVVTAMMGIKDGSVQTAASMRNVQTSAQRLYEMTQNLKRLTERYSAN